MIDNATILAEVRAMRRDLQRHQDAKIEPIVVGATEAAKMLDVCPDTLNRWAKEGKIPRFIEGRVYKFLVEDLKAFAKQRTQGGAENG